MPDHDETTQDCARAGWEQRAIAELAQSIRGDLAELELLELLELATGLDELAYAAAVNVWERLRTPFGEGSPAKDYLGWRILAGIATDVMPREAPPAGAVAIMPLGSLAAYFRANLDRLELENVSAGDLAG